MNEMQALQFFLFLLCITAVTLIAATWLALFLLHRHLRIRRSMHESRDSGAEVHTMLTRR